MTFALLKPLIAALALAATGPVASAHAAAPAAPTLTSTVPSIWYHAAETRPTLVGTSEPGTTVELFRDPDCTLLAGSGTAAAFAAPGLRVGEPLPLRASAAIYGRAVDAEDQRSECVSLLAIWIADTPVPVVPVSGPTSGSETTIQLRLGFGGDQLSFAVYADDPTCTTTPIATGYDPGYRWSGTLDVTVPANGTTTRLYVVAKWHDENRGPCPAIPQVTYTHVMPSEPAQTPAPTSTLTSTLAPLPIATTALSSRRPSPPLHSPPFAPS